MEKRIQDLLDRMTLNEKLREMHGVRGMHGLTPITYSLRVFGTRANKRLNIPRFVFVDGPRGVVVNRSTCFPANTGRGATWDPELERRVGRAMGIEAKKNGANSCGAVCINLLRHPGWGRAQETYGADPHHMAVMGSALVAGLAENVMPVLKHFACNSIELSRFRVNVNIGESALRELYLPHYKSCLDAGAAVVMTAYNKVNGSYCSENHHLIKDILKGEWGFDGFTISDFFLGCRSTARSICAGLDIEMPQGFYYLPFRIKKALKQGKITIAMIDDAVRRILRMKMRFGFFNPSPVNEPREDHIKLALEVARKSIVLLKNEENILPLQRKKIRKLAVIGKLAKKANLGSYGSVEVHPPSTVTPLEGIKKLAGPDMQVAYAPGGSLGRAKALKIAREADAVIIVTGLEGGDEGEYFPLICGGDRSRMELHPDKEQFIKDIAAVNKNCAVVVMGGSAVCMQNWIDGTKAVLMAWYPGMEGGTAIAEILFGECVPSGRLPLTIPLSTDQIPKLDTKTNEVTYDHWHDYRYFDRFGLEPLFPFGHGLGYTTYALSDLSLELKGEDQSETVTVSVTLTNTGGTAGEETVQVYTACENPKQERRKARELKAFQKVHLERGEKKRINLIIKKSDCAYYNEEKGCWEHDSSPYLFYVGHSSRNLPLMGKLQLRKK